MQQKKSQIKTDAAPANRNGFAGREVFAEIFVTKDSKGDLKAEIEAEFRAFSGSSELGYLSRDDRRIEMDLKDALGVPVTVFEPPKSSVSQRQIERLSTELRKLDRAKGKPTAEPSPTLREQVVEEFAAVSVKTDLAYSSKSIDRAERDMSNVAGVCLTVRPYSKSKKRNLKELDRE